MSRLVSLAVKSVENRLNVKTYHEFGKLRGGPGGLRCPCCNPYGCSPRKMKPKARRFVRRKLKEDIKKLNIR